MRKDYTINGTCHKVSFDMACEIRDVERQIRKTFKKDYIILPVKDNCQNIIVDFYYKNGEKYNHYEFCGLKHEILVIDATWCTFLGNRSVTHFNLVGGGDTDSRVGTWYNIKCYLYRDRREIYFDERRYRQFGITWPVKHFPGFGHLLANPGHRRFFNRPLTKLRKSAYSKSLK